MIKQHIITQPAFLIRREAMASAMAELGIRDAAQRIYETVQELL